jgi:hypothetical protein
MKICSKCQQEKEITGFDVRADNGKVSNECQDCRRERTRLRFRLLNPKPRKPLSKTCAKCGKDFLKYPVINGKRQDNTTRLNCYECSPFGFHSLKNQKHEEEDRSGVRTCISCLIQKPLTAEFFSDKRNFLRRECKSCLSKKTIRHQQAQKQIWLDYKGRKCEICGYSKSARALHFHHKNPNEKSFTLSQYKNRAIDVMKRELDKCLLLCANCHAEEHDRIDGIGYP